LLKLENLLPWSFFTFDILLVGVPYVQNAAARMVTLSLRYSLVGRTL